MAPTAAQQALWAAEELWDWRVRIVFACICLVALIIVLAIFLLFIRNPTRETGERAHRRMLRVSATMLIICVAEALFFKENVSTLMLLVTALVSGVISLGLPCAPRNVQIISSAFGKSVAEYNATQITDVDTTHQTNDGMPQPSRSANSEACSENATPDQQQILEEGSSHERP